MKISSEKKEKIYEQILDLLFSQSPKSLFTAHIAKDLARDEEFIKKLLQDLEKRQLVLEIKKNPQGKEYKRRQRWRLTDRAYLAFSRVQ